MAVVATSGVLGGLDIGGGSTEYILARDREPVTTISLRLGVVDLAERDPLLATLDLMAANRLIVSDWGLREGILIQLAS